MKKLTPIQWLTALVLAAPMAAGAQRAADLRRSGDLYYRSGDYYSASVYYQQYIDGGKRGGAREGGFRPYAVSLARMKKASAAPSEGDAEILFRLAESYRHLNDHTRAAAAYEQLLRQAPAAYPEARLGYGMALRATGKTAEAKTQFEQYLQTAGVRNASAARAELDGIAWAAANGSADTRAYTITRVSEPVNGAETNYGATRAAGRLVFTSTRPDSTLKKQGKDPYQPALYLSEGGTVQKLPFGADGAEGAASLTADGNRIYFTRWSNDRGQHQSSIWTSVRSGSGWSAPVKLGATVNAEGSNAKQPSITADGGYLLFASDRAGGQGKWDIWMVPMNAAGEAGVAVNAGPSVNTSEDEETPFFHAPSGTLVFASRGRAGFGGLDLFAAQGAPASGWSAAVNMGAAVNSNKDESYFYSPSTDKLLRGAYFSSDRGNDNCVSVYQLDRQYRFFVAGVVTDCSNNAPLAGAQLQGDGRSVTSAADGRFLLEVSSQRAMTLAAGREGYLEGKADVPAPQRADMDTVGSVAVCLVPKPVEPVAPVAPASDNTVFFDFAKWNLRPETAVTLDTLAAILKREPNLRLVVTGYTDQVGTEAYNLKLSRDRAGACRDYLLRKGIPATRIEVVGKGACCPLKPEKTADGKDDADARQANRRVEFDIKLVR